MSDARETDGPAPIATTAAGSVAGAVENGCIVFRGLPYAAPPVGPLRFRPAKPPAPWTGTRACNVDGPIAPQNASDLAHYMGDFEREQGEDCLTLTVWTPGLDDRRRPVLLWFHGGAYVSGAGSLAWYDGARLALAGDIVVVHANYRLGALGWLCWPGLADGNMGLSDQATALRWVADTIASFGGDPESITIGGQSAGASTSGRLLRDPLMRPLVRRALFQSGGFGRTPTTRDDARPTAGTFLQALDIDPDAPDASDRLQTVPLDQILAAQLKAEAVGFSLSMQEQAWRPIDDRMTSQALATAIGKSAAEGDIDLLIGFTADEGHAFVGGPIPADPDPAVVATRFATLTGEPSSSDRYRASLPGADGAMLLADLVSDYQFIRGSLDIADSAASGGSAVHVYRLDGPFGSARYGAGHCSDLAFLFGNWPHWGDAPMLEGGDPDILDAIGSVLRSGVAAFVRTGAPRSGANPWPAYDAADRRVLNLGRRLSVIRDGGGTRWPST